MNIFIDPDDFTEAGGVIPSVSGLAVVSTFAGMGTWSLFQMYTGVPYPMQPKGLYGITFHFCFIHVTIHLVELKSNR